MDAPPAPSPDPPDPLGPLRRRWWLIMLTGLLGLLGGAGWLRVQDPVWESTTSLLVHPIDRDTNAAGGRTRGPVNLDTEAQLVRSTAVAAAAAERLATAVPPEDLAEQVTVAVPPNTTVLEITFAAAHPEAARRGSQAFADAYLAHREERARGDLAARRDTVEARVGDLDESITEVTERLALTPPDTPAAANLESRRATLTDQRGALTGQLNELATATVSAGLVISEAREPAEPSRPLPGVVLASGAMLGLVVGGAAAVGSERWVRRVRRPDDVSRWARVPVLASLTPGMLAAAPEALPPTGPGGRAFDRLRNEVLAALGGTGQVVVVAGVGRGDATAVAAGLAGSLSRGGGEVILLGAAWPGAAGGPGLSEVLSGRTPVGGALRRHPRHDRLQSIHVDQLTTSTGSMQSPAMRRVLATLTRQAAHVVVAAPPTGASADAQSLAAHADTTLLVVESYRTRMTEIVDAVEQLRRVGVRPTGAVVVPPTRPDPGARWRGRQPADAPSPRESRPAAEADPPSPTGRGSRRAAHTRPQSPDPAPRPVPAARSVDADEETVTLPRLTHELIRDLHQGERRPVRYPGGGEAGPGGGPDREG